MIDVPEIAPARDWLDNSSSPDLPPVITAHDLTVIYQDEPALEGVSFSVRAGEKVAIIGPNGAGKSTLIKVIMGLLQPQSGSYHVEGDPQTALGYVPQNEGVDWSFPVTVHDVVMMGCLRQIGWLRWPGRQQREVVKTALNRVGMSDFAQRQIGELSGGQRRRVFIARALAQQASILLLDEPFSGVDASAQASLLDVLDRLNDDGLTIVLSTHDLGLAFNHFDQVMALRRHMIAFGSPDLVSQPDVLAQLYGSRITTWRDGQPVTLFVDDHHCNGC